MKYVKTNSLEPVLDLPDRLCRVQNLPTSSVKLIWPITELYSRQILSRDSDEQILIRLHMYVVLAVVNLRRFRAALIGLTQGLPKRFCCMY